MSESSAILVTDHASRYINRLCRHWGHKFPVTCDIHRGHIDFGGSTCVLNATTEHLQVSINAPAAELDELEATVADHLQRFAPKEIQLHFNWLRTTQVNEEVNQ